MGPSSAERAITTRWWQTRTLADEDDLYAAMDWLLECQGAIERKLAARHLESGGLVLYDLSSSYFEGKTCSPGALGKNRDGKNGKLQVNYGLLTDRLGCPVAVSVYKGNTGDAKTDRGMISQASIEQLREEQFSWITALKSAQIHTLVDDGELQLGLFDERSLFELTHPDFPDERLIACRDPELAKLRTRVDRGDQI
jgi:transposase